jgi:hypothetical protein
MRQKDTKNLWTRVPVIIRAVFGGILIGMIAANIWPILLLRIGMPTAAGVELAFLSLYVWWAAGGGHRRALRSGGQIIFACDRFLQLNGPGEY